MLKIKEKLGGFEMKNELFEVKSGENKGVYLKVSNRIPEEKQLEILVKDGFGYISSNNVNFYKRHGAATNETLKSLDTFQQVATIWRLNSYETGNEFTLHHKGEKINKVKEKLDELLKLYNKS